MKLQVNDQTHDVNSDPDTPLLWVIRDELGLTGTKYGCGLAQCGACSVLFVAPSTNLTELDIGRGSGPLR